MTIHDEKVGQFISRRVVDILDAVKLQAAQGEDKDFSREYFPDFPAESLSWMELTDSLNSALVEAIADDLVVGNEVILDLVALDSENDLWLRRTLAIENVVAMGVKDKIHVSFSVVIRYACGSPESGFERISEGEYDDLLSGDRFQLAKLCGLVASDCYSVIDASDIPGIFGAPVAAELS